MFPVESAFIDHVTNDWKPGASEFSYIGSACEEWLISFPGSNPWQAAARSLSGNDSAKRMYFAMAVALCNPSENTSFLISRYRRQLESDGYYISNEVMAYSKLMEPKQSLDLMGVFRKLPKDLYVPAARGYRIDIGCLLANAVAWDDLEVFNRGIEGQSQRSRGDGFIPLSSFPVDPSTAIHRHMMMQPQAEQDFLYHRLEAIRDQITEGYTSGVLYLRCSGDECITLKPGHPVLLDRARKADAVPVHKEPSFAKFLMADPDRHIKAFFRPLNILSIDEVNQELVAEITQAFITAGASPVKLITLGPCGWNEDMPSVSLFEALNALENMVEHNQKFFSAAYTAYLSDFTPREILAECAKPEIARIAYRMTGNKALLQAGDDNVRAAIMGADLGL
ncbi:hypothetical protein [Pseudomonas amygdali]